MKKAIIKTLIKVCFTLTFVGFSYESVLAYWEGRVVFENINDYDENLPFPRYNTDFLFVQLFMVLILCCDWRVILILTIDWLAGAGNNTKL